MIKKHSKSTNIMKSATLMPSRPITKLNLFSQKTPEFDDYSVHVYESIQEKCSMGVRVKFKIPDQQITSIGTTILSLDLPPLIMEPGSEAAWVPYIGYAMIKSYGWTAGKDIVISYDKYYAMKLLYTFFKNKEARDSIFEQAGHIESLVNISMAGKDNVVKKGQELNILLPFPNLGSFANSFKFSNDNDLSFFVEFEHSACLINHNVKASIPTSLTLRNMRLSMESFYYDNKGDTSYYTDTCFKEETGTMAVSDNDIPRVKEIVWVTNCNMYTESCRLPFCPQMNATAKELIKQYVDSILPSLVFVLSDVTSLKNKMNNAILQEVVDNVVDFGPGKTTIVVRGLPSHLKVYYNTNIFVKSKDNDPCTISSNVSTLFDQILCDYYPELDLLLFNKVVHRLTIEIVSIPTDKWPCGPSTAVRDGRGNGDNRLIALQSGDFIFRDFFRMGPTLLPSSVPDHTWTVKYDNSVIYSGTNGFTKLFSTVKNVGVLPPYMSSFSFTSNNIPCIASTTIPLKKNKKLHVQGSGNGQDMDTPCPLRSTLYAVDSIQIIPN